MYITIQRCPDQAQKEIAIQFSVSATSEGILEDGEEQSLNSGRRRKQGHLDRFLPATVLEPPRIRPDVFITRSFHCKHTLQAEDDASGKRETRLARYPLLHSSIALDVGRYKEAGWRRLRARLKPLHRRDLKRGVSFHSFA